MSGHTDGTGITGRSLALALALAIPVPFPVPLLLPLRLPLLLPLLVTQTPTVTVTLAPPQAAPPQQLRRPSSFLLPLLPQQPLLSCFQCVLRH